MIKEIFMASAILGVGLCPNPEVLDTPGEVKEYIKDTVGQVEYYEWGWVKLVEVKKSQVVSHEGTLSFAITYKAIEYDTETDTYYWGELTRLSIVKSGAVIIVKQWWDNVIEYRWS